MLVRPEWEISSNRLANMLLALSTSMRLMQWVAQEGESLWYNLYLMSLISNSKFVYVVKATAELLVHFVSCCFQENRSGGPPGTGEHTQPVTSGDGWWDILYTLFYTVTLVLEAWLHVHVICKHLSGSGQCLSWHWDCLHAPVTFRIGCRSLKCLCVYRICCYWFCCMCSGYMYVHSFFINMNVHV